jgi:undecaprenyl-diphosphatase
LGLFCGEGLTLFEAFILSLVQGVTEFLPISSSGHLVFCQKIIGLKHPPVFFDILVHVGTLTAVFIFFKEKIIKIAKEILSGQLKFLFILIIASIPAAIAGIIIESKIEQIFNSLLLLGISFLLNSAILYSLKGFRTKKEAISNLNPQKSLLIGLFQALAILPGVSRSGSTITAGLKTGLEGNQAFEFSFLLAIPAILGALVFKIKDLLVSNSTNGLSSLLGFCVAAITGYISLKILASFVKKGKLHLFAPYTFFLGILSIFLSFLIG